MSEIKRLTDALLRFRDEREWGQFHNAKDLSIALNIEAGELLEAFLWKSAEQADVEQIKEELADVFAYALLLAERLGLDVTELVESKILVNAKKYPVSKARGTAKKYTEL